MCHGEYVTTSREPYAVSGYVATELFQRVPLQFSCNGRDSPNGDSLGIRNPFGQTCQATKQAHKAAFGAGMCCQLICVYMVCGGASVTLHISELKWQCLPA